MRKEPTAIVARLADELQKIQATPEFRDQLTRFGMEPFAPQSPAQFAAMTVRRDAYAQVQWRALNERELNSVCEQLLFALHQFASLRAIAS